MTKKPVKAATKPKTIKPKTIKPKATKPKAVKAKTARAEVAAEPTPKRDAGGHAAKVPALGATRASARASRPSSDVLDRLFAVVTERRTANPAHSHSARLLARGTAKVAQKFGEEAVECLIEAVAGNAEALVAESADVLYHLLVMWVAAGVSPHQVWAELERREGVSGVAEKASRALPIAGTTKIP